MAWWDDTKESEEEKKTNVSKDYIANVKYKEIITKKANSFVDIVGEELKKGSQYRIITSKGFNAITVIEYLMKNYELTEVYIAVYRMNQRSVYRLKEIIESESIKECKILISSFFRENKRYEKWCHDLMKFADDKKCTVKFAHNHAKVFLSKTKCGKSIVFEGSGNLSDNARIEQYIIEDNEQTYNFHKDWINETI